MNMCGTQPQVAQQAKPDTIDRKLDVLMDRVNVCMELSYSIHTKLYGSMPRNEMNNKCGNEPCIEYVIDLIAEKAHEAKDVLAGILEKL